MIPSAIDELKTRARLRLNASKAQGAGALQLRDCLSLVAKEIGFRDWDHARRVLSGSAAEGEDMGKMWHSPRCDTLLNEWFAHHAPAREALARHRLAYLLPYARQFVVVQSDFIRELGLNPADAGWDDAGRDLVQAYGSAAWARLCALRLRATRGDIGQG